MCCKSPEPWSLRGLLVVTVLLVKVVRVAGTATRANWNMTSCELSPSEFELAPWTASIRRVAPNGRVDYFPGVILDNKTLLTSFARNVVAPGKPWRLCADSKYTAHIGKEGNQSEVQVVRVTPNPSIIIGGPGPLPDGENDWTKENSRLILIHLQQPLQLSHTLRPACLPNITTDEDLQQLVQMSQTGLITGWNLEEQGHVITLGVTFSSREACTQLWRHLTSDPFMDHACGYNTGKGTLTNPGMKCIHRDSGLHVRRSNQTLFVGFLQNFFSNRAKGNCDQLAMQYFAILNTRAISWIRKGMKCGSEYFACDNGTCIPARKLCDGESDCRDAGDEDERYCSPRNCCVPKLELACGVYGECIRNDSGTVAYCNGIADCPNGEDEDKETCPLVSEGPNLVPMWQILVFGGAAILLLVVVASAIRLIVYRRGKLLSQEIADQFLEADYPNGLTYDSSYEYQEEECVFENKCLGGGHFGTVTLASFEGRKVAVKTHNAAAYSAGDSSQLTRNFIALLAELKMMVYIAKEGGHPNIVGLVGAHTGRIREYQLQIAMDYCSGGNLQDHLQKGANTFSIRCWRTVEQFTTFVSSRNTLPITIVDLVKWSMHIAQGMEFLSSKKVIHADLATRNVLLDSGLTAKICDFGLSHESFGPTEVYTTTTRLGFSWQWAAPETLESNGRVYNFKSDVWSLGNTLWEIFNLGQGPWKDVRNETELLRMLREGAVLQQPKYCPNTEVFDIMQSCWKLSPELRPSFTLLVTQLQDVYDGMCCAIEPLTQASPDEDKLDHRTTTLLGKQTSEFDLRAQKKEPEIKNRVETRYIPFEIMQGPETIKT